MARTTQKTTKPTAAKRTAVKKSTGTKVRVSKTKKTSATGKSTGDGKSKKTPTIENSGDDKKIQQQDSTLMTNLGSGDSAENPAADPKVPDPPQSSARPNCQHFRQRFDAKVALTYLRSVCKNDVVDIKTAIYMTAVMEYLTTEIAELSCNAARERTKQKKALITQQDVRAAIGRDAELKDVFNL